MRAAEPIFFSMAAFSPMTMPFCEFVLHQQGGGDVGIAVFALAELVQADGQGVRHFIPQEDQGGLADQFCRNLLFVQVGDLVFGILGRPDRQAGGQGFQQFFQPLVAGGRKGQRRRIRDQGLVVGPRPVPTPRPGPCPFC